MGDNHKSSKRTGTGRPQGGAQQRGSRPTRQEAKLPPRNDEGQSGRTVEEEDPDLSDESRWRRLFWSRDRSRKRNAAVTTAWIGAFGTVSAAAIPVIAGNLDVTHGSRAPRSSHARVATVVHTPDAEGIYAWSLPSMLGTSTRLKLYSEGQTIEIVCQMRDGQTIDDPGEGRPEYEVSVWDRLPSGGWISDLYTDLENKRSDDPPPADVRLCHDGGS